MNYEEKYKQALERAETLTEKLESTYIKGFIYHIFPELEESGDERIRKAIISCCIDHGSKYKYLGVSMEEMCAWLEKQSEQKQTWEPSAAQLIVIKDLIEDKNTSKVNKVILRGMFDEFKQFTNTNKREIDDAYLQGICDAKHEIEKQDKKLDPDEVIEL